MGLSELGPGAGPSQPQAIFDGQILDDATAPGQEVRCTHASDSRFATDPLPWSPVSLPTGLYYPKRGDRAVVVEPADGPPVIAFWQPGDRAPDVPS
jgi:hypothetical protein